MGEGTLREKQKGGRAKLIYGQLVALKQKESISIVAGELKIQHTIKVVVRVLIQLT